jgi:hypothetical protein
MYCRASDHDTEECPTLLVKIQEKRNQNNQNVQWISAEARDEGQNINIVTRGGAKIGNDTVRQEPTQNQWVKKNTNQGRQFDAQKRRRYLRSQTRISEGRHSIDFNCATKQGSTRVRDASIIGSYQRNATHGTSKYNQRIFAIMCKSIK